MDADQVFVGGPARLAESFDAVETVRSVLAILEQQLVVVDLLRDVLDRGPVGGHRHRARLRAARRRAPSSWRPYSVDGQDLGAVGLLGPTRMDYPRAMAAAHVVGERLGAAPRRGATMAVTDGLGDLYDAARRRAPTPPTTRSSGPTGPAARELHPDTNHGDPEAEARFKQVTVAYEVLRDPERRARYDRYGPEGVFGAPGAAAWADFGFEGGLGDIFEAFFGQMAGDRRRPPPGPQAGSDAEVRLGLDFAEAVFGCRKEISVPPAGHVRDLRRPGHGAGHRRR